MTEAPEPTERLVMDVETPSGDWAFFGAVGPAEPPIVLSYTKPDGSQKTITFGWCDGHGPAVWRSTPAADTIIDVESLAAGPVLMSIADGINARFTHQQAAVSTP